MAIKPISVSQFNNYVKRILQTDPLLGNVLVTGEISNLKYHGSGHVFLTLKDTSSRLSCFLPAETEKKLRYELAEGMLVTAAGYISVYDKGGTYSFNIRDINVEGEGDLSIAFNALKAKLEKEGIFDPEYKKELPSFPKSIAIITSDTGAAVHDIIKIIKRRNELVDIIVFPCLVQGPDAALDIVAAISDVNRLFPHIDTIITGRGGGSIEELWAFNEEPVVRAIFLSKIPVISAVGHETDFTLADYVSDKRAATPTEAAELAVPDIDQLKYKINTRGKELFKRIELILELLHLRTEQYSIDRLKEIITNKIGIFEMKTEMLKNELTSLSPFNIMERGYGALTLENGKLLTSIKKLKKGDLLTVIHKDGKIKCSVDSIEEAAYVRENSKF